MNKSDNNSEILQNIPDETDSTKQLEEQTMGIYVGNPKENRNWKFIHTRNEITKAIQEGYTAKSMYSFSKEPKEGEAEPTQGQLVVGWILTVRKTSTKH
jgi:hypothetical protein